MTCEASRSSFPIACTRSREAEACANFPTTAHSRPLCGTYGFLYFSCVFCWSNCLFVFSFHRLSFGCKDIKMHCMPWIFIDSLLVFFGRHDRVLWNGIPGHAMSFRALPCPVLHPLPSDATLCPAVLLNPMLLIL